MYPQARNLVQSDGQVETTAAAVLSGGSDSGRRYNFTFTNAGSTSETLILTYSRASGTPRQIRVVTLEADETFEITGLPVNATDVVYAATTTASTVDYLVSVAPDEAPLMSCVYDAAGISKSSPAILEQLALVLS